MKSCPDVVIGSDPEFAVRQNKRTVAASNIYTHYELPDAKLIYVGLDGYSSTGELRPAPGSSPEECTKNIKACIALAHLIALDEHPRSNISIHSGAFVDGRVLGGHVHLGGLKAQVPYKTAIGTLLNKTLGVYTRLVMGRESTEKRLKTSYGKFGDKRQQPWGTEWRTPPSWIISEDFSNAFLELVFFLFRDALTITENYGILREFIYGEPSELAIEEWSVNNFMRLHEYAKKSIGLLDGMYGTDLKYAPLIFDMVNSGEVWNSETDLFESWKIDKDNTVPDILGGDATGTSSTKRAKLIGYLNKRFIDNGFIDCSVCKRTVILVIYGTHKNVCDSCGCLVCYACTENARYRYRDNLSMVKCPQCHNSFFGDSYRSGGYY